MKFKFLNHEEYPFQLASTDTDTDFSEPESEKLEYKNKKKKNNAEILGLKQEIKHYKKQPGSLLEDSSDENDPPSNKIQKSLNTKVKIQRSHNSNYSHNLIIYKKNQTFSKYEKRGSKCVRSFEFTSENKQNSQEISEKNKDKAKNVPKISTMKRKINEKNQKSTNDKIFVSKNNIEEKLQSISHEKISNKPININSSENSSSLCQKSKQDYKSENDSNSSSMNKLSFQKVAEKKKTSNLGRMYSDKSESTKSNKKTLEFSNSGDSNSVINIKERSYSKDFIASPNNEGECEKSITCSGIIEINRESESSLCTSLENKQKMKNTSSLSPVSSNLSEILSGPEIISELNPENRINKVEIKNTPLFLQEHNYEINRKITELKNISNLTQVSSNQSETLSSQKINSKYNPDNQKKLLEMENTNKNVMQEHNYGINKEIIEIKNTSDLANNIINKHNYVVTTKSTIENSMENKQKTLKTNNFSGLIQKPATKSEHFDSNETSGITDHNFDSLRKNEEQSLSTKKLVVSKNDCVIPDTDDDLTYDRYVAKEGIFLRETSSPSFTLEDQRNSFSAQPYSCCSNKFTFSSSLVGALKKINNNIDCQVRAKIEGEHESGQHLRKHVSGKRLQNQDVWSPFVVHSNAINDRHVEFKFKPEKNRVHDVECFEPPDKEFIEIVNKLHDKYFIEADRLSRIKSEPLLLFPVDPFTMKTISVCRKRPQIKKPPVTWY